MYWTDEHMDQLVLLGIGALIVGVCLVFLSYDSDRKAASKAALQEQGVFITCSDPAAGVYVIRIADPYSKTVNEDLAKGLTRLLQEHPDKRVVSIAPINNPDGGGYANTTDSLVVVLGE